MELILVILGFLAVLVAVVMFANRGEHRPEYDRVDDPVMMETDWESAWEGSTIDLSDESEPVTEPVAYKPNGTVKVCHGSRRI